MSRYYLKDKTFIMTEIEDRIVPPQETTNFQGKQIQLVPITYKQIYLGEFPRGKVKNVKIGDDPKTCERLARLGYTPPHNHCFVTQIDKLRQNDQKYRNALDSIPIMKVCVNCGICQLEGSGALVRA